VAGIEALSTREAIQQTQEAKSAGAAAIMLTPPHVYDWDSRTNPEFAVQYFHDIAKAVEIPITIFHYPAAVTSGYTPDTAVRIAREVDNVTAVKVASGANIRRYEQVLRGMRALPRHVSVLATSSLFQHFVTGGDGALTGFANFARTSAATCSKRSATASSTRRAGCTRSIGRSKRRSTRRPTFTSIALQSGRLFRRLDG